MSSDNYSHHISQQASSGLSIRDYCRKHNLTYHTCLYRKKRLGFVIPHFSRSSSSFAEVTPSQAPTLIHADIFLGDARIQVPLCASLEEWRILLQALTLTASC
jgi:hypothetical protein